jgi:hypothetical protein
MNHNPPKIRLTQLWQRRAKSGDVYFSGFLAGARIVILRDHRASEGDLPDGCKAIWTVLLEELPSKNAKPTSASEQWSEDFEPATDLRPVPRLVVNGPENEMGSK